MRLACAIVLAACWSPPRSAPPPTRSTAPAPALDPRAYILGKGVKRDYRVAARMYGERCAGGCADLASCRRYLELALRSRGTVLTADHLKLAARLCDRGHRFGCLIAAVAGLRDPSTFEGYAALRDRCDAGDTRACQDELETDLGLSDSSSHEWRLRRIADQVCAAGVLYGCMQAIDKQWSRCDGEGVARGEACIEWQAAEWKSSAIDARSLLDAWRRVKAACADGDADACEQVPGREIPKSRRCEAGDFEVCGQLAADGDRRAAEVACAGGVGRFCTPPRLQSLSPSGLGETIRILREQCAAGGDPKLCRQAEELSKAPRCP